MLAGGGEAGKARGSEGVVEGERPGLPGAGRPPLSGTTGSSLGLLQRMPAVKGRSPLSHQPCVKTLLVTLAAVSCLLAPLVPEASSTESRPESPEVGAEDAERVPPHETRDLLTTVEQP